MFFSIYVISFITWSLVINGTYSQTERKKIDFMPGWNDTLPSNMYTGYIGVDNQTKFLHYIFVEAFENPSEAPVMLWMQGGPGGSSLMGLFTELGPFNLNQFSLDNDQDVPKLILNENTWSKHANYIFVESPAGVGFSFFANETTVHTDESQAEDAYEFIKRFFEVFQEFRSNDFYVTGESYAGLYVPMLAKKIIDNENSIKFRGILVGNGCTGLGSNGYCQADSTKILAQFLHGHGQISSATFELIQNCKPPCENQYLLLMKLISESGFFNPYNVYDECTIYQFYNAQPSSLYRDYPCYTDYALAKWANHPFVKALMESEKEWKIIQFGPNGQAWDLYKKTVEDVLSYYEYIIDKNYKVTIFSGDVDTAVSYIGGEMAASQLAAKLELSSARKWRPWTLDGATNIAGYVVEYDKNFTFVTIRGAGHMVPQNKPMAAEVMFNCFVNNKALPDAFSI